MVFLGFGKYVRADRIYALEPIVGEERGNGRRTLVWVEGMASPMVASRTQETILEEMGAVSPIPRRRGRAAAAGAPTAVLRRRVTLQELLGGGVHEVARGLLGWTLLRDGVGGRIVEVEAYAWTMLPATRSVVARPGTHRCSPLRGRCTSTARTGSTGVRTSPVNPKEQALRCCFARSSPRAAAI